MLLVVVVLVFFLYDVRAGLIVATTIPLALLFAFICLDLRDVSANLLSIGAVDFGILVDGAVVMVENIFRQIAARQGKPLNVMEIIADAAAEVDRPIFYAVAVIVAGFLPIYVLSGPSGKLFTPMADTMIFALVGSLIVTLTLLPVLCSWAMRKGVRERRNAVFEAHQIGLHQRPRFLPRASLGNDAGLGAAAGRFAAARSRASAPSSCRTWTKARSGCAPPCPTPSRSRNRRRSRPRSARSCAPFPKSPWSPPSTAGPTTAPTRPASSTWSSSSGSSPTREWKGAYRTKAELIEAINEKLQAFPGIIFNYTQPAEDAVDEAETGLKSALAVKVFGADLETLEAKGQGDQARAGAGARDQRHHAGPGTRPAEPDRENRPRQDRPLRR